MAKTAIKGLIKAGLAISVPLDGQPSRLMITQAGREAIGVPAASTAAPAEHQELPPPPQVSEPPAPQDPKGKLGAVIALLRRPEGATLEEMMSATGWQAHSVRGALSGAIKKGRGLTVLSEKTDTGRVYRIPAPAQA